MIVLATGLGKTTVFCDITRKIVESGGDVLIMAHREELIAQAAERMRMQTGIPVGIEMSSSYAPRGSRVVIASVASICNTRLDWFKPSLVICDEAHHAAAQTYINTAMKYGCFDPGGARYLGVTATPHRMDNRPLIGGEETAIFENISYEYGIIEGIAGGYLSDIEAYRLNAGFSMSGIRSVAGDYNQKQLSERMNTGEGNLLVFGHWRKIAGTRQTIVFCVDVSHSRDVCEVFKRQGVSAEYVTGNTESSERARIIEEFKSGKIQVLVNCNIATEGFDAPNIDCVLLMRPTKSYSLFTQMVGRGLRIRDGKKNCIVIDVVGDGKEVLTERNSPARIEGLLGLPPNSKVQNGQSMFDAYSSYADLDEWAKARLAMLDEFSLSNMGTELQRIDLLKELRPPAIVQKNSSLTWMGGHSEGYVIQCGDGYKGDDPGRVALLKADHLGLWKLTLRSRKGSIEHEKPVGYDEGEALKRSDELIKHHWPQSKHLIDASSEWRKRKPSVNQIRLLKRLGFDPAQIKMMTCGDASNALSKHYTSQSNQGRERFLNGRKVF